VSGRYVYAIGIKGSALVKIGISRNPVGRLKTLEQSMPYTLVILHQVWREDARRIERNLHHILREQQQRGEWFDLPEPDLEGLFAEALTYVVEQRPLPSDRRAIVQQWMDEQERSTGYIANKTGYSKQWSSYVINGHKPFSDKLARALNEKLGIQFEDLARSQRKKRAPTKTAKG
jgi:hypothetical protein